MNLVDQRLHDRYELSELLACGGMADVYRGTDLLLERPVAVKVLRSQAGADVRRFKRECRALSRLSHPGIVRLFDADVEEHLPFLVLELVEGHPLSEVLAEGPLGEEPTRRLGVQLAAALAQAHEQSIVHRDVKPSNVLIGTDGRARLTDFGIAQLGDATAATMTGTALGTAAYLAPEQVSGGRVGPSADVYALGLLLLEALTGRRAFEGPPVEVALARMEHDPDVPDDLPGDWPALLRAMTARSPAARPPAASVATWLGEQQATRALPAAQTAAVAPRRPASPVTAASRARHGHHAPAAPPRPDELPTASPERRLPYRAAVLLALALLLSASQLFMARGTPLPAAVSATEVPASLSQAPDPAQSDEQEEMAAVAAPPAPAEQVTDGDKGPRERARGERGRGERTGPPAHARARGGSREGKARR